MGKKTDEIGEMDPEQLKRLEGIKNRNLEKMQKEQMERFAWFVCVACHFYEALRKQSTLIHLSLP